jgi:hypothetical protein
MKMQLSKFREFSLNIVFKIKKLRYHPNLGGNKIVKNPFLPSPFLLRKTFSLFLITSIHEKQITNSNLNIYAAL